MKISILLVDDHALFRKGLRSMLEEEADILVVGEAGDGEEAVAQARALSPDVIVMDISMPNMDGIEATRRIATEFPSVKIIPLSIHSGKRFVENMLRAGAAGYVLKESAPEELVDAIRKVRGGDVFVSQAVTGVVLSEYLRLLKQPTGEKKSDGELTEEERKLLRLIAEGYAANEIATAVDKSTSAVRAARRCLMEKLGLGTATALAEYAAAERWSKGEGNVGVPVAGDGGSAARMPILATKFYPPNLPADYVPRKRLAEILKAGKEAALTLVSAPAGYGKSALVAEWVKKNRRPTVWLSLDVEDSDPWVFLTYLATAVGSVFPGSCPDTRALLEAPQLPPQRAVAGYLANDLCSIGAAFDLVLDDYHWIGKEAVHDLLSAVLEHPPESVHWFILTRRDPPLPMASLRACGQLNEVRLKDLQFTPVEAATVISGTLGRNLEDDAFHRIFEAAEGWITGLRLAAHAFAHRGSPESLIAEMDSARYGIREYLTEQVLAAQTPELQQRLLKISILDRFCAPLCQAVCETNDTDNLGEEIIERLVESGLFVIRMDAAGKWYRFHQLFQHFLEQKLVETRGAEACSELHLRASRWLEENGLIDEALSHASKAGDTARVVDIVESNLHDQLNADGWQVVERWLAKVSEEVLQQRPELLLAAAFVAAERSRIHELPAFVERVETLLGDQPEKAEVLGLLNLFRGQILYWQGEADRSLELFLEARQQIPSSQQLIVGENELLLALARQAIGRNEEALEDLEKLRKVEASTPICVSRLVAAQAFVDLLCGDLPSAAECARRLERLGEKHATAYTRNWGAYLRALTQFHWFDLEVATRSLSELAKNVHFMYSRAAVDSLAGLTIVLQANSQVVEAAAASRKLREFAEQSGDLELLNVAGSCEARLAVWQGNLEPAIRWQRSFREPHDVPSMSIWLELPHITECRVLIAHGRESDLQQAAEKLASLREGLSHLHNTCSLIDVIVLQALVQEKLGRSKEALHTLQEVVGLAEPGGWIRPFVEAGKAMDELLDRLDPSEQTAEFVQQLRASFDESETVPVKEPEARQSSKQPLLEPLTNRELDVLELLGKRLYDKEIADKLSISTGTVKSHLKHIYQKLDVGNRRQAVDRARELGML